MLTVFVSLKHHITYKQIINKKEYINLMPFKNLQTRRLFIHVNILHVHGHIFDQHLSEVSFCILYTL